MPRPSTPDFSDGRRGSRAGGPGPGTGAAHFEHGPVVVRSRVALSSADERAIRTALDRGLAGPGDLILRGTVQFEDAAGPRGRIDTLCRIKLVMSGRPQIVAEERAPEPRVAFERAIDETARLVARARGEVDLAQRRRHRGRGLSSGAAAGSDLRAGWDVGSVIGRRVGRGPAARRRALARPEKQRGDAYVDTSEVGASASDRRAGGVASARRNTRAHPRKSKQVALLEDSRTQPSRKSTRRSATRSKQSTPKERAARGLLYAPSSRAAAAGAPRRR